MTFVRGWGGSIVEYHLTPLHGPFSAICRFLERACNLHYNMWLCLHCFTPGKHVYEKFNVADTMLSVLHRSLAQAFTCHTETMFTCPYIFLVNTERLNSSARPSHSCSTNALESTRYVTHLFQSLLAFTLLLMAENFGEGHVPLLPNIFAIFTTKYHYCKTFRLKDFRNE